MESLNKNIAIHFLCKRLLHTANLSPKRLNDSTLYSHEHFSTPPVTACQVGPNTAKTFYSQEDF